MVRPSLYSRMDLPKQALTPVRGTATATIARPAAYGSSFSILADSSPQASPVFAAASPRHAAMGPPPSPSRGFALPPSLPVCFTMAADVPPFPVTSRVAGLCDAQGQGVFDLIRSPGSSPSSRASTDLHGHAALQRGPFCVSLSRQSTTDGEDQHRSRGSSFSQATVQGYMVESFSTYRQRTSSGDVSAYGRGTPGVTQTMQTMCWSLPVAPANAQPWLPVTSSSPSLIRMPPSHLNVAYMAMPACTAENGLPAQVTTLRPTSPVMPPSSPAWTTVDKQPKRRGMKLPDDVPPLPPDALGSAAAPTEVVINRTRPTGDLVDLYYDQKELFVKGWSREDKGTRSVKGKKRLDYQVDKRKQQSSRDKGGGAQDGDMSDGASDA